MSPVLTTLRHIVWAVTLLWMVAVGPTPALAQSSTIEQDIRRLAEMTNMVERAKQIADALGNQAI